MVNDGLRSSAPDEFRWIPSGIFGQRSGVFYGGIKPSAEYLDLFSLISENIINGNIAIASSGIMRYQATGSTGSVDNGCFVSTNISGAIYQRTGGAGTNTEGILTLPNATSVLTGVAIHFDTSQAPGTDFYLNIVYPSASLTVNGSLNSLIPPIANITLKPSTALADNNPALNYQHVGPPILCGVTGITVTTTTTIRVKIDNYNEQVGANASILSLIFP